MDRTELSLAERDLEIPADGGLLQGTLTVPAGAGRLIVLAHGSGGGRWNPHNRRIAAILQDAGFATVLLDLLSEREEAVDRYTAYLRFDVDRLARRLVAAIDWIAARPETRGRAVGCLGGGTVAAAAIIAATERPEQIAAVVSQDGRPDLAGDALRHVAAPTLLIAATRDAAVLELNRRALAALSCPCELEVLAGAGHLDDSETMDRCSALAADWFREHLVPLPTTRLGDPMGFYEQAWEGVPARIGWS